MGERDVVGLHTEAKGRTMLLRRKEYMKHHDDAFGRIYYFITNELVGYTRSTFQIVCFLRFVELPD